jgi:hypothetical protein
MRYYIVLLFLLATQLGFSQFENPKKSVRIGAVKDKKAPEQKVDIDSTVAPIKFESSIGKK